MSVIPIRKAIQGNIAYLVLGLLCAKISTLPQHGFSDVN